MSDNTKIIDSTRESLKRVQQFDVETLRRVERFGVDYNFRAAVEPASRRIVVTDSGRRGMAKPQATVPLEPPHMANWRESIPQRQRGTWQRPKNNGSIKVRWDTGQTRYFRHRDEASVKTGILGQEVRPPPLELATRRGLNSSCPSRSQLPSGP
jgi:hypothetical protein